METQLRPITKRELVDADILSEPDFRLPCTSQRRSSQMYKCDRSTGSGILRPRRVGGDLAFCLHDPNLARRPGGSALFGVIAFPKKEIERSG
jgi:hypothetical protein